MGARKRDRRNEAVPDNTCEGYRGFRFFPWISSTQKMAILVCVIIAIVVVAPYSSSVPSTGSLSRKTRAQASKKPPKLPALSKPIDFRVANKRMDDDLARGEPCDVLDWLDPLCSDAATVSTCTEPLRFNYAHVLNAVGRQEDNLVQLQLLRSRFAATQANIDIQRTVLQSISEALLQTGQSEAASELITTWLLNEQRQAGQSPHCGPNSLNRNLLLGSLEPLLGAQWHGQAVLSLLLSDIAQANSHPHTHQA